jgi:hypothetical protein
MPVIRKDFGHLCLSWRYHFRTKHHLYGNELRAAPGVLDRFDSVFGRESPHNQCQLKVGCHLNGSSINPPYVFRGASTTSIHFHNKFCGFHDFSRDPATYWKELKEVLTTHGHRNSPVHDPEFPSFHEADTQSLF